jgi:hypothetical protein
MSPAMCGLPKLSCEYRGCKEPVRYTTGEGRKQKGYCRGHAPFRVRMFQRAAHFVMWRGHNRRRKLRAEAAPVQNADLIKAPAGSD